MWRQGRNSLVVLCLGIVLPSMAIAQPARQMPGSRPFLAVKMPQQGPFNPPNSRVRPAISQIGVESTDFYGKKGYPKQIGDLYETTGTGNATGTMTGMTGAGGAAGNTGNTGVQSSGSNGFQGNAGTMIGGGSLFGGNFLGGFGNGGGQGGGGLSSITGGGFAGLTPKGFGFGGVPE